MSVARQLLKKVMTGLLPHDRFLVSGPNSRVTSDGREHSWKEVALTFDDGPHPEWTPDVLDALAEAGWKGTFFVIGDRAAEHPDVLQRIMDEGHALGNHTFTHSDPKRTTTSQFHAEVRRTDELIAKLTGKQTVLMRPPKGHLTPGKFRRLWQGGQTIVLWNVDPEDFAMSNASEPLEWVHTYVPNQGDVILLHDRLPYAATIIRALSNVHGRELRSVTMTDWLSGGRRAPQVQPDRATASG